MPTVIMLMRRDKLGLCYCINPPVHVNTALFSRFVQHALTFSQISWSLTPKLASLRQVRCSWRGNMNRDISWWWNEYSDSFSYEWISWQDLRKFQWRTILESQFSTLVEPFLNTIRAHRIPFWHMAISKLSPPILSVNSQDTYRLWHFITPLLEIWSLSFISRICVPLGNLSTASLSNCTR